VVSGTILISGVSPLFLLNRVFTQVFHRTTPIQAIPQLQLDYRKTGTYSVIWDGRNNQGIEMPSGIYLYTLKVDDKVFTKKLTLLK